MKNAIALSLGTVLTFSTVFSMNQPAKAQISSLSDGIYSGCSLTVRDYNGECSRFNFRKTGNRVVGWLLADPSSADPANICIDGQITANSTIQGFAIEDSGLSPNINHPDHQFHGLQGQRLQPWPHQADVMLTGQSIINYPIENRGQISYDVWAKYEQAVLDLSDYRIESSTVSSIADCSTSRDRVFDSQRGEPIISRTMRPLSRGDYLDIILEDIPVPMYVVATANMGTNNPTVITLRDRVPVFECRQSIQTDREADCLREVATKGMWRHEWRVNCSAQSVSSGDGITDDLSYAIQSGGPSRADFVSFHVYQYACQ